MTHPGIQELTEKEKEALRLLLEGHDAKSSAGELDLSVHTINDRLRNARRKLGVSSSREAARILGDAEGQTPQFAAPETFGMGDSDAPDDTAVLTNTRRAGAFRSTWLAGGMLVMSILIAAAVIAFTVTGDDAPRASNDAEPAAQAATENPDAAESLPRAKAFIAELDAGDWSGSWEVAGVMFQSAASAEEWAETVEPVREPLGAVKSRQLTNVNRVSTLPGAPEGDYEVLQFRTVFSARPGELTETIVMTMGRDGWEVAGYFVT